MLQMQCPSLCDRAMTLRRRLMSMATGFFHPEGLVCRDPENDRSNVFYRAVNLRRQDSASDDTRLLMWVHLQHFLKTERLRVPVHIDVLIW